MSILVTRKTLSFSFLIFLSGCAGYDRALLVTKTNVGLDIDSTPPTAEITIARRELAIQPTFPDQKINTSGDKNQPSAATASSTVANSKTEENLSESQNTLPLLASFGLQGGFFNPRITGYFAGGDAAVLLLGGDLKKEGASICLQNEPADMRSFVRKTWDSIWEKNDADAIKKAYSEPRPFYFSTDTAFGLKVAWTGTGGPYPDTLKLGYNRKEFASAPVFIYEGCEDKKAGNWKVRLPSFLASIDNHSEIGSFENSGIKHVQFFATGRAATEFAKKTSVQQVALEGISPAVATLDSSELHQYLFLQIKEAFDKANDDTKKAVLNKAISNDLIPKTTTSDGFISALKENKYLNPQRLYSIKQLFDLPQ
ncbi:MAG: hypothetical protein Q8N35_01645 [Methylococcaceae bacterium]|nr:hypothetical protein [Methylococcaceae bacterium]MDZ4155379.1 hypothetical protein [Methylococcales bacterium]MDP2392931.1 hypothetical protein [Methylococcaceae bacterium]MDP3018265.1 hypothetical protein [Methylococcaceae bacterium]MDP3391005.1 hypothetical protein [Methylococcaceae bacterium]